MNQMQNQQNHSTQAQGQQQNKIKNPQSGNLPKIKGPEMNDRDRVNDALATEKHLILTTNIAAWEASHQELHQDIMTICQETQQCHRTLFDLMFQEGWYSLEAEEQQKLDQSYQQFSNYSSQFPYPTQVQ